MERAGRETWAERVEQANASGLTLAQAARKLGVSEGSLKWWKWRLGSTSKGGRKRDRRGKARMSPLTFVEMAATATSEPLEVSLANGLRVRVPADFDAAALGRLLDVLERRG